MFSHTLVKSINSSGLSSFKSEMFSHRLVKSHQFFRVLLSPTDSATHTGAARSAPSSLVVTHLGVVGRGLKCVLMNAASAELSPSKKLVPDCSKIADAPLFLKVKKVYKCLLLSFSKRTSSNNCVIKIT